MTMTDTIVRNCVCPACHGGLDWTEDRATCALCGRSYPVVDGIPVLANLGGEAEGTSVYKQDQAAFFDSQPAEWETARPHGAPALYGWLMSEKFQRSTAGLEGMLAGATVATVCGGSGMDAEFLAREGAAVIASDISLGAARRTRERGRRFGVAIAPIVADAEALPFATGSIDIAYVHDGLHHLEHPLRGLEEMARVARRAVSVNEPARALATAVAVRLGISEDEEEAGNRVERLDPDLVVARLRDAGYEVLGCERYAMYYRHEPGSVVRGLSRRPLLDAAKLGFTAANRVLGPIGNKLSVRAVRKPQAGEPSANEDLARTRATAG
jgi:SAM-dependent methyltransferase/uncharacterized protein YbaR (Trm112 family)